MRSFVVTVALLVAFEPSVHADAASGEGGRTLGDHVFVPFRTLPWPFVTTDLALSTGLGTFQFSTVLGSDGVEREGEFIAVQESLDFALALTRWFGLEVGGTAVASIGQDGVGAVDVGTNIAFGGHASAILAFVHLGRLHVAARVDASALRTVGVVPIRLIDGIQVVDDSIVFDEELIVTEGDDLSLTPAAIAALGVTRWLGVQVGLAVDLRRTELEDNDQERAVIVPGVGADVDLGGAGVPVSLLAGGRMFVELDADPLDTTEGALFGRGDVRGQVEGGVAYVGRDDLVVAGTYTFQRGEQDERHVGALRMTYFW